MTTNSRALKQEAPLISPEGDCAVRVQFGEGIDPAVNRLVHGFCRAVDEASIAGVVEWAPAYCVATVYYRPEIVAYDALRDQLADIAEQAGSTPAVSSLVQIPVAYGGEFGPDLGEVAHRCRLSEKDVIAQHSGRDYRCYMIGFMPGFPYLGELPEELRLPRRETPRVRVPAGSVAIAEAQTGIYPRESPGGWHLIGRVPLPLFDPESDPPVLISAGESVRFVPIDRAEYEAIACAVARGKYVVSRTSV